jgi:hypothetical protein
VSANSGDCAPAHAPEKWIPVFRKEHAQTHDLDTQMDAPVDSGHIANLFPALNRRPEQEHSMRVVLLTAAVIALFVGSMPAAAPAADIYGPPPAYGQAPPPAYPPAPRYGYVPAAPPVAAYGPPPGVIAAPEGPAYIVSQPAYQPGDEYAQGPFLVDGRRYYRECWIEWGQRRCTLKPRWWW